MIQVVNGLRYNTDTAVMIIKGDKPNRGRGTNEKQTLYKTTNGNWFFLIEDKNEIYIQPTSEGWALKFLVYHSNLKDA